MKKDLPLFEVFDLQRTFGINKAAFLDYIRPTFSILHLDPYDATRNKIGFLKKRFPEEAARLDLFLAEYYAGKEELDEVFDLILRLDSADVREFDRIGMTGRRKRSIARFILSRKAAEPGVWHQQRVPATSFQQNVDVGDARALVRTFHEAPAAVADYPPMRTIMSRMADMIRLRHPEVRVLRLSFHQMFIFTDAMSVGENAPEGIHQDGTDYVISALVIERAGIVGGESIVYAPDKKTEIFRYTLAEGEGLFQDDKTLWHYVTPIKENPASPLRYGHRSILGFDVEIIG
jgi:hypothetical protein